MASSSRAAKATKTKSEKASPHRTMAGRVVTRSMTALRNTAKANRQAALIRTKANSSIVTGSATARAALPAPEALVPFPLKDLALEIRLTIYSDGLRLGFDGQAPPLLIALGKHPDYEAARRLYFQINGSFTNINYMKMKEMPYSRIFQLRHINMAWIKSHKLKCLATGMKMTLKNHAETFALDYTRTRPSSSPIDALEFCTVVRAATAPRQIRFRTFRLRARLVIHMIDSLSGVRGKLEHITDRTETWVWDLESKGG